MNKKITSKHLTITFLLVLLVVISACGKEKSIEKLIEQEPVNLIPIADAGNKSLFVEINTPVKLDGTGSFDHDKSELTYRWEVSSAPDNSSAGFKDAESSSPIFTPDKTGLYSITLIVNDGTDDSTPDKVTITAVDTGGPESPATLSAFNSAGKKKELMSGNWYNYSNPYFEWSAGVDYGSGIQGYFVYFGHNPKADPNKDGTYTEETGYELTQTIESGGIYYVIVSSIDNEGNASVSNSQPFVYQFDTEKPETDAIIKVEENYAGIDVGEANNPYFADVDNDLDLDLFVGEYNGSITFFENTGTQYSPKWGYPQYNYADTPFTQFTWSSVGNLFLVNRELLVSDEMGGLFQCKNIGTWYAPKWEVEHRDFGRLFSNPDRYGFVDPPAFADIDHDGDLDYFVNSYFDEDPRSICFYENTGTSDNPSWPGCDTRYGRFDTSDQQGVTFYDIDMDNDLDMFTIYTGHNNRYGTAIYFYENTGTQNNPEWADPVDNFLISDKVMCSMAFANLEKDSTFEVFTGTQSGSITKYTYPYLANKLFCGYEHYSEDNFEKMRTKFTNHDDVNVSLYARDNVGVSAYYISQSPELPAGETIEWNVIQSTEELQKEVFRIKFSKTDDGVPDGEKTFYIWYKDQAGNISDPVSDSIIKDSLAEPPVSAAAYSSINKEEALISGASYNYQRPYFEWEDGDTLSGTNECFVYFGTSLNGGTTEPQRANSYQVSTDLETGTTYYLVIHSSDFAGNIGEKTLLFTYTYNDATPPSVYSGGLKITEDYTELPVPVSRLTFVDLDKDGDKDIFANSYYYIENTGTRYQSRWGAPIDHFYRINSGQSCGHSAFCDIDNDGDQDLFVGSYDWSLKFYENDGYSRLPLFHSGQFLYHSYSRPDHLMSPVTTFADIDDDGDYDLFFGNRSGTLVFMENTGTKTQAEWPEIESLAEYQGIDVGGNSAPAFGDVDRDGDLDLVVGLYDGTLTYYENIGNASAPEWAEPVRNYLGIDFGIYNYSAPVFTDLDNDGNLELYVAGNEKLSVCEYETPSVYPANQSNPAITSYTTNSQDIQVSLYATDNEGIKGCYISNSPETPDINAEGWFSFIHILPVYRSGIISHTLDDGPDGERTVYVWFKDRGNNISPRASMTVTLAR